MTYGRGPFGITPYGQAGWIFDWLEHADPPPSAEDLGDYPILGTGPTHPLEKGDAGYLDHGGGTKLIKASITQILGTKLGERVGRPTFGSRLYELVFEPNDTVLIRLARVYVINAIRMWERRVDILTTDIVINGNILEISINFEVKVTRQKENLVYPYYLEGRA